MSEGWNILVVDDEPPIRAELRYLLEKDARVGQIAEAGNVTEAVESILSNKPDVLFLDITMPGRSGIELAETLQNLKTPPVVVFVTAFAEFAADAYNLDAVDYVVKPVEDARLSKALDKIETALGARRVIHAPRQPLRLTVDRGGKKVFIPAADVCYFEARADFCNAICAEGSMSRSLRSSVAWSPRALFAFIAAIWSIWKTCTMSRSVPRVLWSSGSIA